MYGQKMSCSRPWKVERPGGFFITKMPSRPLIAKPFNSLLKLWHDCNRWCNRCQCSLPLGPGRPIHRKAHPNTIYIIDCICVWDHFRQSWLIQASFPLVEEKMTTLLAKCHRTTQVENSVVKRSTSLANCFAARDGCSQISVFSGSLLKTIWASI